MTYTASLQEAYYLQAIADNFRDVVTWNGISITRNCPDKTQWVCAYASSRSVQMRDKSMPLESELDVSLWHWEDPVASCLSTYLPSLCMPVLQT